MATKNNDDNTHHHSRLGFEAIPTTASGIDREKLQNEEAQAHQDVQRIRSNPIELLTMFFLEEHQPVLGGQIDDHLNSKGYRDNLTNRECRISLAREGFMIRRHSFWSLTTRGQNACLFLVPKG